MNNYRSVSILPLISKVFPANLNLLLCEFQQGYGTPHALLLLQAWQKEIHKSGYTRTVLMDLLKAYGCLPHDLIITKFEAYRFYDISLKLFHGHFSIRN